MLRDITLGQYYQTESVVHRLDPRVKLGGTLLFIISLFLFRNFLGYGVAVVFLGVVIGLRDTGGVGPGAGGVAGGRGGRRAYL